MMQHARIHPRTLGYLGRALSLEYSAVQQYMTQAALCEAWGLADAADRFRRETVEEMGAMNIAFVYDDFVITAPTGSPRATSQPMVSAKQYSDWSFSLLRWLSAARSVRACVFLSICIRSPSSTPTRTCAATWKKASARR